MQYHAHALAAHGVDVDVVGFEGTPLPRAIADEPRIAVHRIEASALRKASGGPAPATRSPRSSMPPGSACGCGARYAPCRRPIS